MKRIQGMVIVVLDACAKDGVDGAGYGIGHSGDGHIEPRMGWVLRVKVVMVKTGEDENDGDDAIPLVMMAMAPGPTCPCCPQSFS